MNINVNTLIRQVLANVSEVADPLARSRDRDLRELVLWELGQLDRQRDDYADDAAPSLETDIREREARLGLR